MRQTCVNETIQWDMPFPSFPQVHIRTALTTPQVPPFLVFCLSQRSHMEWRHPTCIAFLSLFSSLPHLNYFLFMSQDTQEYKLRKGVCHLQLLKKLTQKEGKKILPGSEKLVRNLVPAAKWVLTVLGVLVSHPELHAGVHISWFQAVREASHVDGCPGTL